jgi:phosphatidylinositol alpha-1,6-mannosyltransferase
MKVLLFTLEYPPQIGGVANYYENLVKYWGSSGNIFVLNNNDDKLISNELPFLKWFPAIKQLHTEIIKNKIGYVLIGNILPLGTIAWLLSKILKFRFGVVLHGTDITYAQKTWRKKNLAKIVLKNASHIVCNSEFTQTIIATLDGSLTKKCTVVYPGVSPQSIINSQLSTELINKFNLENKIVLFSIGRLIKRKGVDRVIEAMPEILREIPNLVYFVGGGGPDEKYLKHLADKNNLFCHCEEYSKLAIAGNSDAVVFLGKIADAEKWAWLELCDIFVQPTREDAGNFDGFGIVYLEANSVGKPVIAGRSGGTGEAVIDNFTGLMVDPESLEEIKNAIVKLASDIELRKKLGEQGRSRVLKDFQWKNQINKIYNSINNS